MGAGVLPVLVKFGIYLPQTNVEFDVVKKVVLEAEALGYDSAWLSDHLIASGDPRASYLECWTALSAIAGATNRIRLGTLVLCNLFRNPSLLAKMASTLDHISKGRLEFGIGAGWNETEASAYGVPFPTAAERIQRLEEALEIVTRIWKGERASFQGKFYRIEDAYCNPKPVQAPHPPIWIGTMLGRKRMHRLIAQYADAWTISSLFLPTPDEYLRLHRDLQLLGRGASRKVRFHGLGVACIIAEDEAKVKEKSRRFQPGRHTLDTGEHVQHRIEGTPEQCAKKLAVYAEMGATHFLLNFPDITSLQPLRLFAEKVMPILASR